MGSEKPLICLWLNDVWWICELLGWTKLGLKLKKFVGIRGRKVSNLWNRKCMIRVRWDEWIVCKIWTVEGWIG